METLKLGEVTISRVVELGRSSFPTASMLPDSTPEEIAAHLGWLRPDFFDETTGDLASRIQTYVVRTPRHTILIDTGVGNDKVRAGSPTWHRRHSGDLMHRTVQVAEPRWSSRFCHDPAQAARTRTAFVERHADTGVLVAPAHFPTPGFIVREDGGFRFVAARG